MTETNRPKHRVLEIRTAPDEEGQRLNVHLNTEAGEFISSLGPFDAAELLQPLLLWCSSRRDPEGLVLDIDPVPAEGLFFEQSETPGRACIRLVLGVLDIHFELPIEHLFGEIARLSKAQRE